MKTSIRTFTIITVITLTLSGLSFSIDFPATTTTTPSGRAATTSIIDNPVRGSTTTTGTRRSVVSTIPDSPVKRDGESDEAYQARLQEWLSEIQRMAATASLPVTIPSLPERPIQRRGESPEAYQARVRAWEAQVQQTIDFAKKTQDLQRLIRTPRSTGTINTSGSNPESILIIPTEEMKTESLLAINEDMNVMSQIFRNELLQNGVFSPKTGSYPFFIERLDTTTPTGYSSLNFKTAANPINSMYLADYGVLFLINVDFPLSASPEVQEQPQEPNKGEVDQVWQQTKQQIYEPQTVSAYSYIGGAENLDVKYDAQKVENLKKTFITALKHASNIRVLKPDESIIIRISEMSTLRTSIKAILNNQYFIQTGNGGKWVQKEDLPDNIKNLPDDIKLLPPPLNAIVIRAKKSDIDAYGKGELDFDKFREKVQVFSYPLLSGNTDTIRLVRHV